MTGLKGDQGRPGIPGLDGMPGRAGFDGLPGQKGFSQRGKSKVQCLFSDVLLKCIKSRYFID